MLLLRESFAIFRRNPFVSTFTLFLFVAASMAQVASLSALYPILQMLMPDQSDKAVGALPFVSLLAVFVVLSIGYSILNWTADFFQNLQFKTFETAIRRELFESAVRAKWTYGRDLKHGEFLSVMLREVGQYKELIRHLLHAASATCQSAALLMYAFYLNWQLTGLGMLMFATGGLLLMPILRWSASLNRTAVKVAANMSNRLVAGLRALKTVKALSLERYLIRTVEQPFEDVSSVIAYSNSLGSGQYAVMEIVAVLAISSILYVGLLVRFVPKAQLIVILLLLFRALPIVRLAVDNYHRANTYIPSMQTVRAQLTTARTAEARSDGAQVSPNWTSIDLRNVWFAYEGRSIIRNLSLTIRRGEFWAIIGTSGSGKTTTLDLMTGLLQPDTGAVLIDGIPLEHADLESWHEQIAYLGQDAFVFAGTVRDNLTWGSEGSHTDAELWNVLRAARLDGGGKFGPDILDRDAGEDGCNLSGGEKQRLALARLFLRQPSLVILDEPTTGLDAATEKDIFDTILSYFRGTTILMVTHREELTLNADHIIRVGADGVQMESGVGREM